MILVTCQWDMTRTGRYFSGGDWDGQMKVSGGVGMGMVWEISGWGAAAAEVPGYELSNGETF